MLKTREIPQKYIYFLHDVLVATAISKQIYLSAERHLPVMILLGAASDYKNEDNAKCVGYICGSGNWYEDVMIPYSTFTLFTVHRPVKPMSLSNHK